MNNFLENSKNFLKLLNENIDNCIDNNDGHYPNAGQIIDCFIVDSIGGKCFFYLIFTIFFLPLLFFLV